MSIAVPLPTISIDRVVSLLGIKSGNLLKPQLVTSYMIPLYSFGNGIIKIRIFQVCSLSLFIEEYYFQVAILIDEKALTSKPIVILDVRPEEQFAKGHIIGGLL